MHKLLLGIEHLITGVQLRGTSTTPDYPGTYTFHMESPSIIRVLSDGEFMAYWPHTNSTVDSTPCTTEEATQYEKIRYSHGEAEWWARVAGEALRQTYHLPTAKIAGNQPPDAVIRVMRRKHGKEADKYIQQLRWDDMNKCWFYTYAGMYLGVEQDGYIHS